MISLFSSFRIFNILYQMISTFFIYGIHICNTSFFALLREGLRGILLILIIIKNKKHIKPYLQKRRKSRISFIVLIVISVLFSFFISKTSLSNIVIGIKYCFWRTFILLSASFIGFTYSQDNKLNQLLHKLPRILIGMVILGFLWQGAKILRPEFFFSFGYGKLNDYAFGTNPPIYYLTSFQGTLRRQGLFSGPNNYGYFLVAFFPLIRGFFTNNIKNHSKHPIINYLSLGIWIVAMGFTLSRSVIIGGIISIIIIYRRNLKNHKKICLRGGLGLFVTLACLSVLKRESTIQHISSKIETIPEIISAPFGHGLGSSGPSIHYEGKYLPENYYLQIMLDIGTVGFLFRIINIFYILQLQYKIYQGKNNNEKSDIYKQLLHRIQIGFFSMLVMGLFLHVFEDSMVNYLFFTIYGISIGILSKDYEGNIGQSILGFIKLFLSKSKTPKL